MNTQFTLGISKPCSENFNNFKTTKAGGFCSSCKKDVIDFTGKSSSEILNYFKENTSKNTCGRFADFQLGKYIEPIQKSKKYSFWKGLGLACLSIFSFNTVQAQEAKTKTEILESKKIVQGRIAVQKDIFVKGTVSDNAGPLPGVSILLQGTSVGTDTDFDGNFEFPKKLKKGDVLILSFVGMISQKIVIENKESLKNITLKIDLTPSTCIIMGAVAVKKVFSSKK